MCLLSIILDTVGLFLRVWLWISVPMAVLILVVATWLNYRQHIRPKVGLNLAMDGWAGEDLPATGLVGSRITQGGVTGGGMAVDSPGADGEGLGRDEDADRGSGKEGGAEAIESGRETAYQGILWMKEKYEQYREQADRRYGQLKEELGRSERRYHELVAAMERAGKGVLVTAMNLPEDVAAGKGEIIAEPAAGRDVGEMTAGEGETIGGPAEDAAIVEQGVADERIMAEQANGGLLVSEGGRGVMEELLLTERCKVEELERELRGERTKVEELVIKLQANSQLLVAIYQELDKSLHLDRLAN